MPKETQDAVNWALTQTIQTPYGDEKMTKHHTADLTEKVRQYFNENEIEYSTFSYADLITLLN